MSMQAIHREGAPSRRGFLQGAAVAAATAAGGLRAAESGQEIKVGLVGCGGRGTGAAAQALQADDYAVLTAVADIDQARIDQCLEAVEGRHEGKQKVRVTKKRQFLGLDAYQEVSALAYRTPTPLFGLIVFFT